MATGFSVYVNIGGKLDRSLAGAVGAAKAQVNGLGASLAGIGARTGALALSETTKQQRLELKKVAQSLAAKYDAGGATGIKKTARELTKAGFTYAQARGSLEQVPAAA